MTAAKAVHRVLHVAYAKDSELSGLGSLHDALDAELEAAGAPTAA